jgi:hypothetical protein
VILDGDGVEWCEQAVERPVDLVGFVVKNEVGEWEVEFGWEVGGEGGGDFAEQTLWVGAERSRGVQKLSPIEIRHVSSGNVDGSYSNTTAVGTSGRGDASFVPE